MRRRLITIFLVFIASLPTLTLAQEKLSDQQVAEIIVRESRQAYYRTGRPCACPEDLARNGSRCGGRSAYSRPGGATPLCYLSDVTAAHLAAFRARQPSH
jgi:hypothetical protein